MPRRRVLTGHERERQEQIDRENRILLRKILEQHHGIRRNGVASGPGSGPQRRFDYSATLRGRSPERKRVGGGKTSNQINAEKLKHKRDYENLLLLQKIQNVKPSKQVAGSVRRQRAF